MKVEKGTEQEDAPRFQPALLVAGGLAVGLSFIGGLAAGRIVYEWLFPDLLWLGRPLPGLLFAALVSLLGWLLWRALVRARPGRTSEESMSGRKVSRWNALLPFLPLALNLAYLLDPAVNLERSRFLFLASVWLAAVFLARLLVRTEKWRWLAYVSILAFLLPVYLATMGQTVGTADTFEFQVVVPQSGIVHPTGYPLYLLLAKPFTWLPLNDVAWRVNLATLVFGLVAICLLYTLIRRLTNRIVPALLAAVIFGLAPTFWSQAIEAEVYSLHALIVAGALLVMREIGEWGVGIGDWGSGIGEWGVGSGEWGSGSGDRSGAKMDLPKATNGRRVFRLTVLLAFVLGLGLTNHLTTVVLLPAAGLTIFMAYRQGRYQDSEVPVVRSIVLVAGAFLLPLLLYAYLPLRWAAVNGEAMGLERFVDWVIGGRFQGALQLTAWLKDGARYEIAGRLLTDEWPLLWGLPWIVIGVITLFLRQWRYGLILAVTWLGYTFYALNYYVPDLAVFLIPAHLIMAVFWAVGLVAVCKLISHLLAKRGAGYASLLQAAVVLLAITPALLTAAGQTWPAVDSSGDDGRSRWAEGVLELPIAPNAAILADSDKFPPLYYLQQAEGVRPDLDIMLLPDEAAYRAELESRIAAGQPLYLARFLPGLESVYHLRSLGPLTEVGLSPATLTPAMAAPEEGSFGPVQLLGYQLAPVSPFAGDETAVTFYWQTTEPLQEVLHVYTRWAGDAYEGPITSQHPAGNTYPTVAWRAGEVVPDYHALSQPAVGEPANLALQVALAPPFTPASDLAWRTVAVSDWSEMEIGAAAAPLRMQLRPLSLDGATIVEPARREAPVTVQLSGYGAAPESLLMAMVPAGADPGQAEWQVVNPASVPGQAAGDGGQVRQHWTGLLGAGLPAGDYDVLARYGGQAATCSWLARQTEFCIVGEVSLSGVSLPPGAVNFEDKIAMLSVEVPQKKLAPGGELALTVTWQGLAQLEEDYTVFVQVLDENDRIVGQVDAWPLQGTFPTSSWTAGEPVEDPYLIRLSDDLPPGRYKLYIGWYLLETLRRLPVVDQDGLAVDDKVVVPGLSVSE